jgi:hypothetical protein
MAVRGTPQSIKDKWLRNIQSATPDITAGIQRVTQAPGQAAAAQSAAWQANTIAAADKWKRNTAGVSLADWQAAATAGVGRIASGAQAKQGKMETHLQSFLPHLEAGQRMLASMPRGSMEQNLARMVAMARHNANYKRPNS